MKKITALLLIIYVVASSQLLAQSKIDLGEYVGRYILPAGLMAEDVTVVLANDTTLNISASIGECDLEYTGGDSFSLARYGGSIAFLRDDTGKVKGFEISIPMADIDNIEARKEEKMESKKVFETHGHRGNRGGQPENTIVAMISAMDMGVTTLELDLQVTKDKQVVVSHDPHFNEKITTTPEGKYLTKEEARKRTLYSMDYDSIKKYDVGLKPNPEFPSKKNVAAFKPLLSDLLKTTEAHSKEINRPIYYNIEIKSNKGDDGQKHPPVEEFVDLVMDEIVKANIKSRTILQSFDDRALQIMHHKYPNIALSLLIEDFDKRPVSEILESLGFIPQVFSPHYSLVTPQVVDYCHKNSMKIIPWTVNDEKKMAELKEMGVDGIITDYPEKLVKIVQ